MSGNISAPANSKPGIFYGYIVVGLSFLVMLVAFGLMDSFGVFVKPLLNTFGWSRATTSAAYSMSFLIFGFVGIVMGGLTDKFGIRLILTGCGVVLGIGYLLMSQTSTLWHLYLFEGVIIGVGMSALYAPVLSLVARWFNERRGLMTGIVSAGLGIGQLILPPINSRLIEAFDWRMSFWILGIAVLVIIVIVTQFLKRPDQVGQAPYGEIKHLSGSADKSYTLREAASTVQFWLLVLLKFSYGYYMFSIVVHIVPHITDFGISAIDAANVMAVGGLMMVVGSFTLGRLGDKFGPRKVILLCFVIALLALLWLLQAKDLWALYLFSFVFGIANGGLVASDATQAARLFGLKWLGSIVGISSCAFSVGAAVGPVLTGYIFDSTQSYQIAFIVAAAVSVLGFIVAFLLRPTKKLQVKL